MEDKKVHDFDVVILGSGPAGLQAAVHAARSKAGVAVVGGVHRSSLYKAHIENYCCMNTTLTGQEVLEQGRDQAEKFGARFFEEDVVNLGRREDAVRHYEKAMSMYDGRVRFAGSAGNRDSLNRMLQLFEKKGNTAGVEWARMRLSDR